MCLPLPALASARSRKANTVSLDGTPSMDPRRTFARLLKTLPYACGSKWGKAIAGWVENLPVQLTGINQASRVRLTLPQQMRWN